MDTSMQNQRVLITAGAAGIGRAMAATFEQAGARVHICDVDVLALASFRAEHPNSTTSVTDVADDLAVGRMFDDAQKSLGGLDVLINNAGIAGPTAPIEDIAPADWERCLGVGLNSVFHIRVNCIQPGFVAGERIDRVVAAKAAARGITIEEQQKEFVSRVSLRTMVTAEDIANMALFLASAAGQHISGQALSVCGNVETLG